jgi:capsular polysaccharide biosynthesis protein
MANRIPVPRRRQVRGNRETGANGSTQASAQPADVTDTLTADEVVESTQEVASGVEEVVMADVQPGTASSSDQEVITVIHTAPVYSDVVTLLRVLVVNFWIILLLAALGAAAGFLYTRTETDVYVSEGTMIITIPGEVNEENLRDQLEVYRQLTASGVIGNYVVILRSDLVRNTARASVAETYDEADIRSAVVEIIPVQNSSFVTIEVTSTIPELARDMVTALYEAMRIHVPAGMGTLFPAQLYDLPELPTRPVSNTRLSVLFGAGGGAALGVALAFMLDYYRQHQRSLKKAKTAAAKA